MTNEPDNNAAEPEKAENGKPFSVTVEDGAVADDTPATITMQPESPEDQARAEEARERVEQRQVTAQTQAEMDAGAKTIGVGESVQPALARVEAEKEAGRQRIAEHASRQALLDAKRAEKTSEASRVAAATETNKDL